MVTHVQQGELLRLEGFSFDVLVLSKELFNSTGYAILCPILHGKSEGALTIPVHLDDYTGIAHLEDMRGLNLAPRHFKVLGRLPYGQTQNISDAAQSILDYYPY